jgi:ketosteroid isomerase-like protein
MGHYTPSEAIATLIYRYAERIDAGDFAGVADIFAEATLTFEGFGDAVSGRDALRSLYERTTRRYEDGTPRTKHVMTNVMVDVAEDGALTLQPIIAGRYHNAYACVDGEWQFAAVHIIIDLYGDLGHHMLFDLAP